MSDGYRNGAFALGLVTGGGVVLNLFLWSAYQANKTREEVAQTPSNDQHNQYVVGSWDWFVSTFIIPDDTIAQWGMAVLSLAAVYLLWETLKASRQTLKATREMAQETREVGEAQATSYIVVDKARISSNKIVVFTSFIVRNIGQSPAHQVQAEVIFSPSNVSYPKGRRPFSKTTKVSLSDMEPEGTRESLAATTQIEDADFFARIDTSKQIFYAVITVTWLDVFGWERTGIFHMSNRQTDGGEDTPEGVAVMRPGKTEFSKQKAN